MEVLESSDESDPLEICDLANLQLLDLGRNQMPGSIPQEIGTLSSTHLDL